MRNRVCKALPLAIAFLLAVSGAALAGDNAAATLSITTPVEISGVGPSASVQVTLAAAGMVNVKQFDITLEVSPASAFVLSSSSFALGGSFASAISPGVEFPAAGQVKSGGAILFGSAVNGSSELGTFTLTTAADFTTATTATIKVVRFSLGPTSTTRDVFTETQLNLSVTVNPPAPPPTVTAIDPATGYAGGGTAVTITGTNFQDGATVTIGGVAATDVVVASATSITAKTPAGAVGAADVVVANPDGKSATLTDGFTYTGVTVTSIDPASGYTTGGTAVTITGTNFLAGATVTIGGAAATDVVVASATSITAKTPAGAEGAADVVVTNADGRGATLTGGFTYLGITEPRLTATSARDVSADYSAVGTGDLLDGSAGEVTFAVRFNDYTGAAVAGQTINWTIANNGAEPVYLLSGGSATEIAAGGDLAITRTTGAGGTASITLDAEGDKGAATTSVSVEATTSSANSVGEVRALRVTFAATWEVPVAAELASFAGSVTPDRKVLLQWSVASQSNNLGWEVYRSLDKVTFVQVGELVLGDGTTDQFKSYSFVDRDLPQAEVLYYYLNQVDLDGTSTRSSVIEVALSATAVAPQTLPVATALWQNYPNPFNPETTLSFDLSETSVVDLTIYNAMGQVVRNLVKGQTLEAGHYQILWDGRDECGVKVGSGVYLYQLQTGTYAALKKMMLVQ